jgi:hypothetical protein
VVRMSITVASTAAACYRPCGTGNLVQMGTGPANGEVNDDDLHRAQLSLRAGNERIPLSVSTPPRLWNTCAWPPLNLSARCTSSRTSTVDRYRSLPLGGTECRVERLFASAPLSEEGER